MTQITWLPVNPSTEWISEPGIKAHCSRWLQEHFCPMLTWENARIKLKTKIHGNKKRYTHACQNHHYPKDIMWLLHVSSTVCAALGGQTRASQSKSQMKDWPWHGLERARSCMRPFKGGTRAEHSSPSPGDSQREKRVHHSAPPLDTHACVPAQKKVSSVLETRSFLYYAFSLYGDNI